MKKLLAFGLAILLLPQLVLAAWWNPFSWFNKPTPVVDTQIQVLKDQIKELEQKLNQRQEEEKSSAPTKTTESGKNDSVGVPLSPKVTNASPRVVSVPITEITTPTTPEIHKSDTLPAMPPSVKTVEIPDPEIKVVSVGQSILKDDNGWPYGGYRIVVNITANKENIYVPMSTNDSTDYSTKNLTGFAYTINGDKFRGLQNSKVSCSISTKNFCKIEAGKSKDITTTVWLLPNETGNYGITFDHMIFVRGSVDGTAETHELNRIAQKIYLQ